MDQSTVVAYFGMQFHLGGKKHGGLSPIYYGMHLELHLFSVASSSPAVSNSLFWIQAANTATENVELDPYQERMPVGYTEGGTVALNVAERIGEASMPLYSLPSQVKYLLSNILVTAGDGALPAPVPYPQVISEAPEAITSEHLWPVPHTLPLFDSVVGAQLTQIYQAQPPPDHVSPSTRTILNFQNPVNSSGIHHLDS